jgi:hypothetical protein
MAPELEPPGRCSGTRFRGPTLLGSGDYASNGAAEGIRTSDPRITNKRSLLKANAFFGPSAREKPSIFGDIHAC